MQTTDVVGGERSSEDLVSTSLHQRTIHVVAHQSSISDDHLTWKLTLTFALTLVEPCSDPRSTTGIVRHQLQTQLCQRISTALTSFTPDPARCGAARRRSTTQKYRIMPHTFAYLYKTQGNARRCVASHRTAPPRRNTSGASEALYGASQYIIWLIIIF